MRRFADLPIVRHHRRRDHRKWFRENTRLNIYTLVYFCCRRSGLEYPPELFTNI
jgi:hypothetical protein